MRSVAFLPLTILALSGACARDHGVLMSGPEIEPIRLAVPDSAFRLSAEVRATVYRGFDVDALERLLARTRPDLREEFLFPFQTTDPGPGRRRGHLYEIFDPELQAILEEVWAPMWDDVSASDEDLEQDTYGYPGREIAIERREARRRARQQGESPPE